MGGVRETNGLLIVSPANTASRARGEDTGKDFGRFHRFVLIEFNALDATKDTNSRSTSVVKTYRENAGKSRALPKTMLGQVPK